MTTGLRCCRCCLEVLLCSPLPFRGDEPPYISGRQGGHKWPHPIRHPGLVVDLYSRGMYKGNKNSSVQNLVLFPLLGKYLKTMKANTCRLRSRTLVNSLVTSKSRISILPVYMIVTFLHGKTKPSGRDFFLICNFCKTPKMYSWEI